MSNINGFYNFNPASIDGLNTLNTTDISCDSITCDTGKFKDLSVTGITTIGQVIADYFAANNFYVNTNFTLAPDTGTLTLPANSIADAALSSNIPKKNTANTYTSLQTLHGGLTMTGTLTLPANSISDNYLTTNVPLKNTANTYTSLQTFSSGVEVKNSNIRLYDNTKSTFINQYIYSTEISNESYDPSGNQNISFYLRNDNTGQPYQKLSIGKDNTYINNNLVCGGNLTISNGNIVFTTGNKTITNGTGNILTLPTTTTTLIGNNTTDTLTNKTIEAATFTGDNVFNANAIVRTTNTTKYVLRLESTGFGTANNSKSEIYESDKDFYIDLYDYLGTLRNQLKLTYSGLNLNKGGINFSNDLGTKLFYLNPSPTDQYYCEIQSPLLRQVVPSYASHRFMVGITDKVVIDTTDTTFYNNIVQSGTNIIYQTGTGENLMKRITQTDTNTIYQTGTGDNYLKNIVQVDTSIIYQVGTSTNTFKNTNFIGDIAVLNDKLIRFYDSTNTKSTFISQFNYSMEISNESYDPLGSQNISFYLRNDNTGTPYQKLSIGRDVTTISNNLLCQGNLQVEGNIILNSTYTAKTSGQLGYRINGTYTYSGVADFEMNTGIYNLASILLPIGVWSIIGQCCYERRASSTPIVNENNSISELVNVLDGFCQTTHYYFRTGDPATLEYPIHQITKIVDVETPTTLYLQLQLIYFASAALKPRITSVTTTRTRFYAVRIA